MKSQIIECIWKHLSASNSSNPSLNPLFHTWLNSFISSLRVAWSFKERLGLHNVQFFINNMAQRKESRTSQARGKHPMEVHHQEARKNARYDTNILISMEEQSRYLSDFSKRKIWAGKSVDFLRLHGLGLTG